MKIRDTYEGERSFIKNPFSQFCSRHGHRWIHGQTNGKIDGHHAKNLLFVFQILLFLKKSHIFYVFFNFFRFIETGSKNEHILITQTCPLRDHES